MPLRRFDATPAPSGEARASRRRKGDESYRRRAGPAAPRRQAGQYDGRARRCAALANGGASCSHLHLCRFVVHSFMNWFSSILLYKVLKRSIVEMSSTRRRRRGMGSHAGSLRRLMLVAYHYSVIAPLAPPDEDTCARGTRPTVRAAGGRSTNSSQVGAIGLIKAVDGFRADRGGDLGAYAVPTLVVSFAATSRRSRRGLTAGSDGGASARRYSTRGGHVEPHAGRTSSSGARPARFCVPAPGAQPRERRIVALAISETSASADRDGSGSRRCGSRASSRPPGDMRSPWSGMTPRRLCSGDAPINRQK